MLGGTDGQRLFADAWTLDLGTMAWAPRAGPPAPVPALFHSAVLMRGRYLVTFGGVTEDNATRCGRPAVAGDPLRRPHVSLSLIPFSHGKGPTR